MLASIRLKKELFEVHVLFSSWKPILERILAPIVYVILMQCLMHMGYESKEGIVCSCLWSYSEFECWNIPSALETKDHGWKEKLAKRLSLLAGLRIVNNSAALVWKFGLKFFPLRSCTKVCLVHRNLECGMKFTLFDFIALDYSLMLAPNPSMRRLLFEGLYLITDALLLWKGMVQFCPIFFRDNLLLNLYLIEWHKLLRKNSEISMSLILEGTKKVSCNPYKFKHLQ